MTAIERFCPAPRDAADPGFLRALELDTMVQLVQRHLVGEATLLELVPDYVRWKERDGSLLGYRAIVRLGGDSISTYVTARTAPPHRLAEEAERLSHRADDDHAGLRAMAFVPTANLLLLGFPIDRAIHDLRRLVRASKVRSLLAGCCPDLIPAGQRLSKSRSTCRLVRYKPERRAVLQWQVGRVADGRTVSPPLPVWVRCHAASQATRTHLATAAASAAGVRCPRTLGVAHERLAIESHVEGTTWDLGTAATDRAVAAAAAVVARLHGAAPPIHLPGHNTLNELDLVLRATEDLARLDVGLGHMAQALAETLALRVPQSATPVLAHGDLHGEQILLGPDTAGLCDFDRACLAPAAHDLGTFRAHCVAARAERGAQIARTFVDHYARHRALPDRSELDWWTSCALLRRATTPFRNLRHDWPDATAWLLLRVADALRGDLLGEVGR